MADSDSTLHPDPDSVDWPAVRAAFEAELAELEGHEGLAPEVLAAELGRAGFEVMHVLTASEEEDEYLVTHSWTLKGLRHAVAEARIMERVQFWPIRPLALAGKILHAFENWPDAKRRQFLAMIDDPDMAEAIRETLG